eukprot:GHVU01084689.1.p1 GENE.GHVU01084689.1~~GHVU01084689.1.p1  ORF type:complete len:126 (+),score=4.66 GHVU01084689.1:828-1205(+)
MGSLLKQTRDPPGENPNKQTRMPLMNVAQEERKKTNTTISTSWPLTFHLRLAPNVIGRTCPRCCSSTSHPRIVSLSFCFVLTSYLPAQSLQSTAAAVAAARVGYHCDQNIQRPLIQQAAAGRRQQ